VARTRAFLLALDDVRDQLEHLIDARGLCISVLEGTAPVRDVTLGGELVEVRARHLHPDLRVRGYVLCDLRAGQLDAVELGVVPGAELQPRDKLELLERRHLVQKPLHRGFDQ
jgi:hypothetical protein